MEKKAFQAGVSPKKKHRGVKILGGLRKHQGNCRSRRSVEGDPGTVGLTRVSHLRRPSDLGWTH